MWSPYLGRPFWGTERQFGVGTSRLSVATPGRRKVNLLLEAAGVEDAQVFVAALDDRERQNQLVAHVSHHHPDCHIIARALDRHHVYELEAAGAHEVEHELFEASLNAGRLVLIKLGAHPFKAERQARAFRARDRRNPEALRDNWHDGGMDASYIDASRQRAKELDPLMQTDRAAERHDTTERGWTPAPRSDASLY